MAKKEPSHNCQAPFKIISFPPEHEHHDQVIQDIERRGCTYHRHGEHPALYLDRDNPRVLRNLGHHLVTHYDLSSTFTVPADATESFVPEAFHVPRDRCYKLVIHCRYPDGDVHLGWHPEILLRALKRRGYDCRYGDDVLRSKRRAERTFPAVVYLEDDIYLRNNLVEDGALWEVGLPYEIFNPTGRVVRRRPSVVYYDKRSPYDEFTTPLPTSE